ncbi:MAG: hypothetical protein JWQ30_1868, partial [Sediminibacterium sp.]|nr:hypothetical protein [Sediminibacterium sp.]
MVITSILQSIKEEVFNTEHLLLLKIFRRREYLQPINYFRY